MLRAGRGEPMRANPEMLILARELAGETQSSMATKLSFSQGTLSRYESGLLSVPDEHLNEIATTLDRPLSFFHRDAKLYGSSGFFHRKQSRLTQKELRRIHAHANEMRIRADLLLREAEVETDARFYRLPREKYGTPEAAARELRRVWQLPGGPVRSVVGSIESAGGIVFLCDFKTPLVDGLSQWPIDDPTAMPVLFVNGDAPGDRMRFTLAHELGHIVMHHVPPEDDPEDEANAFASEFLMPAAEIADDLSRLTLEKAASLKSFWRTSIASIVRRAFTLEKITERQYRYLCMQIAKLGYHRREPIPIPQEEPELFDAIVKVHRTEHRHSDAQMAERMGMYLEEFQNEFGRSYSGLRLLA